MVNGILLVSSFCDVCSAVSRSIWVRCFSVVRAESLAVKVGVVTTETPQS